MTSVPTSDHETIPAPEIREVSPGIYAYLQLDGSWGLNNTGFIVGKDAVTVIDSCFTAARTQAFIKAIHSVADKPLPTLINTHHHGDHTFGNYQFTSATIIGHELCRSEVQRAQLSIKPLFPGVEWGDLQVSPPFVTFEDRLTIYVDDLKLELIFVGPAHTKGDILIWIPERRVLFAGDVFFKDCTPLLLEGCLAHYFETLAIVRGLNAEIIVPGHGPICGPEVIDEVEGYLHFVQFAAGKGFEAGLTPLEAARQTELGAFAHWPDSERIVGNIARAYSELRGEPLAQPLDLPAIAAQMIEYNGGPLRCLA